MRKKYLAKIANTRKRNKERKNTDSGEASLEERYFGWKTDSEKFNQ